MRLECDDIVIYNINNHFDMARGFKAYGEQVLDKLDQLVASDANLKKAPVNHEGVGAYYCI